MLIKIGDFDCTECWYGVFYKKFSSYPNITEWEIQTVLDFIAYESKYGRNCEIEADNQIINAIEKYKSNSRNAQRISGYYQTSGGNLRRGSTTKNKR